MAWWLHNGKAQKSVPFPDFIGIECVCSVKIMPIDKSVSLYHLIWIVVPWYHQNYENRWGGSCQVRRASDIWKTSSHSCWKDLRQIYPLSVSWISWVPQSFLFPPQLMILVWHEAQACWMSCTQREPFKQCLLKQTSSHLPSNAHFQTL